MALAQRRGETDEEYENRKKRVKRQRQGIGEDMFARMGGGGGGGGSGSSGHCITQGTDGTNYGIKRSLPTPFGSVDPERTPEGVLIYDFYCQASGEVVLRLGDDGEYEVPGIIQLDISYNTDQVLTMTWLALENMYIATDHDFTDYATAIPVDEEYCVDITRIPVDLPTRPTLLRVGSTTDTSISLLWNASTQGTYPIASYNVQADALLIGTPASNAFTWNSCPPNEEVSYRVQAVDNQGNIGPWSNTLVYTNEVAVAPIYLMTEPLFNDGSFDYLVDSANTVTDHYGQLLTSTDTAWNPDSAQYPQDGTIDFSGGNKADTQWVAPQDTEWTMSGVYNVVSGVSYDMYSIHYKGNQTCDIYLGSNTEDLTLSESDKDYTPPTEPWVIEEEPPDIIIGEPSWTQEIVYIAYYDLDTVTHPTPSSEHVTQMCNNKDDVTVYPLYDTTNTDTGWTAAMLVADVFDAVLNDTSTIPTVPPNDGYHFDAMMNSGLGLTSGTGIIELVVDAGTYTITSTGTTSGGSARRYGLTINGGTRQTVMISNNTTDGISFSDVVADGSNKITLVYDWDATSDGTAYTTSLTIVRTA